MKTITRHWLPLGFISIGLLCTALSGFAQLLPPFVRNEFTTNTNAVAKQGVSNTVGGILLRGSNVIAGTLQAGGQADLNAGAVIGGGLNLTDIGSGVLVNNGGTVGPVTIGPGLSLVGVTLSVDGGSITGGVTIAADPGIYWRFDDDTNYAGLSGFLPLWIYQTNAGNVNAIVGTNGQLRITKTNFPNNHVSGPTNAANLVLDGGVMRTNEVGSAMMDLVGSVFTTGTGGTNINRPTGRLRWIPNVASASLGTWVFESFTNSSLVNGIMTPQAPGVTNFSVTTSAQGGQLFVGAGISLNGITLTRGAGDILQSSGRLLVPSDVGAGTLASSARLHAHATSGDLLKLSSTGLTNAFVVNNAGDVAMALAALLTVPAGADQRVGSATLVGGTITVNNTRITANTKVMAWFQTIGGTTAGILNYTVSAGASFTVNSVSATGTLVATDISVINYFLIENP